MNRLFLLASAAVLAACATEGVDPIDPIEPTDGVAATDDAVDGVAPPPVHFSVRKVSVFCGQDFDGNDLVNVSAVTDLGVRLALASFHRADESDAVELGNRIAEPIDLGGHTTFSKNSLYNSGRFTPGETSPLSCASLADFAVKVVVAFEDGTVGCALAGNAAEVAKLRCED
jgi:hypothetical protein